MEAQTPPGRIGQPDDIGPVAVYAAIDSEEPLMTGLTTEELEELLA